MIAETIADYCAAACGATVFAASVFAGSCFVSAALALSGQHAVHSALAPAAVVFFSTDAASSIVAPTGSIAAASGLNEKLFSALPSLIVTFSSFSPNFSCQATSVYSPSGTLPLIVYFPSSPLTAWNGCSNTPMYALIHGCTSHFTRKVSVAFGCSGTFLPGSLFG